MIKSWWRSLTTKRLDTRSFQSDLDWFRFAVAARVHEARIPAGRSVERDAIVEEFILGLPGEKWTFVIIAMLTIFILGFFIDFVEIAFIVVPILAPIAEALGLNMMWFAILIAMNLQSSFLTPPFGFSLFYLKGVAPAGLKTTDIYRGAIPFIAIQLLVLTLLVVYPEIFGLGSAS